MLAGQEELLPDIAYCKSFYTRTRTHTPHTHTHTHTHTHAHTHTHTHAHTHTCSHTHTHMLTHTHIHTCSHTTRTHARTHTRTLNQLSNTPVFFDGFQKPSCIFTLKVPAVNGGPGVFVSSFESLYQSNAQFYQSIGGRQVKTTQQRL